MDTKIRYSMSFKVVFLVTILTVVIFTGLFLANSYSQKEGTIDQLHASSKRASGLLEMAIEEPMRVGDNQGTVEQFRKVGNTFKDIRAFLTDSAGSITYSTDGSTLRKDLRGVFKDSGDFKPLFEKSLKAKLQTGSLVTLDGAPYYAAMQSIENAKDCYHCHGKSKPILGVMVTLQDVSHEMEVLKNTQMRNAAISVAGLILLLGLLLIFVRRSIIKRITILADASDAVRRGELDMKFRIWGTDELASLGHNLQAMVADLKAKMEEARRHSELATEEARRAHLAREEADDAKLKAARLSEFQRTEVENLSEILQKMAHGDLSVTYITADGDRDTEEARESFLEIQTALNQTISRLAEMLAGIQDNAETLAAAAEELSTISSGLSDGSEELSDQAGNVAGAAEQISSNINTMAAATEEMSANVHTVSTTTEQMSVTMETVAQSVESMERAINRIAQNSAEGSDVAARAMKMAHEATSTMSDLGEAAQQIGKVTEVIKRIAEQTNLLALNATIEAASAGDAGKGFAVVAHEIKELANQSAKAAEDISAKIEGVQGNTGEAIKVIDQVSEIIGTMNESVAGISRAVERQTQATNEISLSVSETSKGAGEIASTISELAKGANDISQNAGEVARAVNEVAGNILGVSRSAESTRMGARQVDDSAGELARVAGELKSLVDRFVADKNNN